MLPDLPDATGFNTQFEFSSTHRSPVSAPTIPPAGDIPRKVRGRKGHAWQSGCELLQCRGEASWQRDPRRQRRRYLRHLRGGQDLAPGHHRLCRSSLLRRLPPQRLLLSGHRAEDVSGGQPQLHEVPEATAVRAVLGGGPARTQRQRFSFGQAMSQEEMRRATAEARACG